MSTGCGSASSTTSAHVPVRTCVGCRRRGPRSDLVRLVAGAGGAPEGPTALVVDVARSLPGRGAWLHPQVRCLELAERRGAFARALRRSGPVDTSAVREHLDALGGTATTDRHAGHDMPETSDHQEAGLRPHGHPMSTLR